MLTKFEV